MKESFPHHEKYGIAMALRTALGDDDGRLSLVHSASLQLSNDACMKKVYNDFMLSCMKLWKTDYLENQCFPTESQRKVPV